MRNIFKLLADYNGTLIKLQQANIIKVPSLGPFQIWNLNYWNLNQVQEASHVWNLKMLPPKPISLVRTNYPKIA